MLDWDDLRFFLAVSRLGTLAGAAKHLHVTQSTVGRRLASMQAGMGVRLLQRTPTGYVLTLAGESIRASVERVEAETLAVQQAIAGRDMRLEGLVRVTSPQLVTSHLLAPCFAALHAQHPDVMIESYPFLHGKALVTQDAEISVRLQRFEHQELIVRNIGEIAFGLYASVAYLARFGEPDVAGGCPGHQLITFLDADLSQQANWLHEHVGRALVVLKAESYETQHWAAYCGGGVALLPRFRADPEPTLRRIITREPIPNASIWLGVHRENRATPRIRTVLDCIAGAVRGRSATLNPVIAVAA
jgi:DNA-binding transcriptional LysR family regulator